MAKCLILRKFSGERPYEIGESVELSGPHLEKLIAQRYISLAAGEVLPVAVRAVKAVAAVAAPAPRPRGRPKGSTKASKARPAPSLPPTPATASESN